MAFRFERSVGDEGNTLAGTQLDVQLSLDMVTTEPVIVRFAVTGGDAVKDADFAVAGASDSITIEPAQQSGTIAIQIKHDRDEERDETIELTLVSAVGAELGTRTGHTVTIGANVLPRVQFASTVSLTSEGDAPGTIVLALDQASPEDIEVTYALLPGATATPVADHDLVDGTLTFPAGTTTAAIPLTIVDDQLNEGGEGFEIELGTAAGAVVGTSRKHEHRINDNDPPPLVGFTSGAGLTAETGTVSIDVTLSAASGLQVTVDFAVVAGASSATGGGVDFALADGRLTFPPGTTTLPIRVAIQPDDLDEINETITLGLSRPVFAGLAPGDSHVVTISDDDDDEGRLTVGFVNGAAVTAETGTVNVDVTLSGMSATPVTVAYAVVVDASSATGGGTDFTLVDGTLTFPPGTRTLQIPVAIQPDDLDENNETITIALRDPTNATLARNDSHVLAIADDDALPSAGVGSGQQIDEGDTGNTEVRFPVLLSAPSGRVVTVNVQVGGTATLGEDYELVPGDLPVVFQPGQTSRDIRVIVHGDSVREDGESVFFGLLDATNATLLRRLVFLGITDDD